jgi:hypothetical protein
LFKIAEDASMAKSLPIFLLASGWLLADPALAQAVDPGIRTVGLPGDLEVLPGANATEQELFFSGIDGFGQGWEFVDGFGPRFNAFNCTNCHTFRKIGGSSSPNFNAQERERSAVVRHQRLRGQGQRCLQLFSAEALAVEQGQTNMIFPNESDETPGCHFAPTPNLNLTRSIDFTESAALFMKFLAPSLPHATVPGGADSIARGRATFGAKHSRTAFPPRIR